MTKLILGCIVLVLLFSTVFYTSSVGAQNDGGDPNLIRLGGYGKPASPTTVILNLGQPQILACGDVSINGGVSTSSGTITNLSWNWGDGFVTNSFFPATHRYAANGQYTVVVTAFACTGETNTASTSVVITNATDPACSYTVMVYPSTVSLMKGKTSENLTVELRDANGQAVSLVGQAISFVSTNPSIIQVNAGGVVSSTGFGEAQIQVTVAGFTTFNVQAVAGEFRVEPPILLLTPVGQSTGQLTIVAKNANGTPFNLAGHSVSYSGGNAVATVSQGGLVTALRPPQTFPESPIIWANIDGMASHNGSMIRVTSSSLGLALQTFPGDYISYLASPQFGPYPYAQLIQNLQAVKVTDAMNMIEERLTGITPNKGDTQFLVMDPGTDSDGTVPCGISGNPSRFGVGIDNLRSCLGGSDYLQWGIIGHELGHNFLSLNQVSFNAVVGGLPNVVAFNEGMPSMLGMYAIEELTTSPAYYGLTPATVANLSRSDVPITPAFGRNIFFSKLTSYETNPNYATAFDPDVNAGILLKLHDQYGREFFYRFLSAFSPADKPLPISLGTEGQKLAFWVAACSAAANADLKSRFRDTWGFPIDNAFYDQIFPKVKSRVERRDALVLISGRIRMANGRGVTNAAVSLTNRQGVSRVVVTDRNGNYRFDNVPSNAPYTLTASQRRFNFSPRFISIAGSRSGIDLAAAP